MTDHMALFAGAAVALYAAHHVGDYWIQTDHQARHKGLAGRAGRVACTQHVLTYLLTQWVCLTAVELTTRHTLMDWRGAVALAISGITHWTADRREHGLMVWLARRLPGKARFLELGAPRAYQIYAIRPDGIEKVPLDNPSLGTGAWALDQAWHIFFGVFVAALVVAS